MTAPNDQTTPPAADASAAAPPAQAAAPAITPPAAAAQAAAVAEPTNPWDDPAAAKAEIERLRRENGSDRVNAKTKAAEEAKAELAQQIGRALGLVKDEAVDPAQLAAQLTTRDAEAKSARLELAVFQAAPSREAAVALLDSRSFMETVKTVDPADAAAVNAAVGAAVTANPALAATPSRLPAPNPALGSSASGAPSVDEQIAAAQKAGDTRTVLRLKSAQALAKTQ